MTDQAVMGKNYEYLKDKGAQFILNFVKGYQEVFEKGYKEVIKTKEGEEKPEDGVALSSGYGAAFGMNYGEIAGLQDYERGVAPNWERAMPRDAEIDRLFDLRKLPFEERREFIEQFKKNFQLGYEKAYYEGHFGAIRNNNTKMFNSIGPDTGYDSIDDNSNLAASMSRFFDRLQTQDKLTKSIIYNLNPRDNYLVATMVANFQEGPVAGKIQFGSGWWFLDQKDGMEDQMNVLSTQGLLSRFVGMLTDSRSFISYPRHEYFRRILCNLIGNDIEEGLLPASEMEFIGQMVENISYYNAKDYFKF